MTIPEHKLTREFCNKRIREQNKYLFDIGKQDLSYERMAELSDSAMKVRDYFCAKLDELLQIESWEDIQMRFSESSDRDFIFEQLKKYYKTPIKLD